jgi:hypothetical protein
VATRGKESVSMAVRKIGGLSPESVDATMQKLKQDPALRDEMISELLRQGARAYIEQAFDLDERQSKEINLLKDRNAEEVVERALVLALVHNGSIKVVHKGHETANLDLDLEVSIDESGFHVEVTLTC